MNFLEQLVAEWYQYKGYYVRQNVRIGKRKQGGYDGEIDIVAFHPQTKHLIHFEVSSDASSWEKRDASFKKKFKQAQNYIPGIFEGFKISDIEQKVILFSGSKTRKKVGNFEVIRIQDIMKEMYNLFKSKKKFNEIVSENYPLVRAIQVFIWSMDEITKV